MAYVVSMSTPQFALKLEIISNLTASEGPEPPPEPQVTDINLSTELGLTYGANTSLKIMLKYRGRPVKYVKFLSYDRYNRFSWNLSKGDLIVLNVFYNLTKYGSAKYRVGIYIKNYNIYISKEIQLSNESDYTLLEYGGEKVFRLNNLTLLPMPPLMAFGSSPLESTIPVKAITSVIPVPKTNTSPALLNASVYVDKNLRYVGIDLKNKTLEGVLIKSIQDEKFASVLLGYTSINACDLVLRVMNSRSGIIYSEEFIKYMKNLTLKYFLPMCTYGGSVYLSRLIDVLIAEIRTETHYGPVNLSTYKNTYSDAVTAFLIYTREGVCIHYASALALMLKFLGVNSSIAIGLYYVGTQENRAIYGLHAWTEVEPYIPGVIAYVNVDPSPQGAVTSSIMSGGVLGARGSMLRGPPAGSVIEPFPHVVVRVRGRLLERLPGFEEFKYDPLSLYLGEKFFSSITSIITLLAVIIFILTMSRRFVTLARGDNNILFNSSRPCTKLLSTG